MAKMSLQKLCCWSKKQYATKNSLVRQLLYWNTKQNALGNSKLRHYTIKPAY